MNLPPFVYSLSFWEGISFVLAGAAVLLVYFGVLPTQFAVGAAAILTGILAVLKFFNIVPELRARGLM